MLPLAYYRTISRYLMNQWILTPAMVVGFIALIFNAGIKWFFVWGIGDWPGWGLDGTNLHLTRVKNMSNVINGSIFR